MRQPYQIKIRLIFETTIPREAAELTYLDNDMASKSVDRYIRAAHIYAQGIRQVIAECIQITLRLLDLGELLGAAGFRLEVNG